MKVWLVTAAIPGVNIPLYILSEDQPTHEKINEAWMAKFAGRADVEPLKDPAKTKDLPLRECYPSYGTGPATIDIFGVPSDDESAAAITADCMTSDTEADHSRADGKLTDLLHKLGFPATLDAYAAVAKWYA